MDMNFEERIKKINDIDQEFENDVLRGFGDALDLIDDLYAYIRKLEQEIDDIDSNNLI